MYECEFCGADGDRYDMNSIDPVVECQDCADKVARYWHGQYKSQATGRIESGAYDRNDPKNAEYFDYITERAGV